MSNFAHSFIRFYINWVAAMVELVDTRDLKSLDPKRSCGFESRSRHTTHGHSKRVSGYG